MSQQQSWIMSCKACSDWGRKDHGTVKVDGAALHAGGKENTVHPNTMSGTQYGEKASMNKMEEKEAQEKAAQEKARQDVLRRQEEERKEMERRVREEHERQQAELQRREAERQRLQMEEEAREREERLALLKQEQEQGMRLEEQQREEARKKLQEEDDQKRIRAWLQANSFKGLNDLAWKRLSKVTPLHCAIQQKDVEMLTLLLQNGADASKVNSKNQSALTVAQKMDKKGSHAAIVQALMSCH